MRRASSTRIVSPQPVSAVFTWMPRWPRCLLRSHSQRWIESLSSNHTVQLLSSVRRELLRMRRPPTATRMDLAGEMASSPAGGTVAQGVGGASDEMMLGAGNELVSSTLSCATSTSSATPLRTGRTNKLGTMHSKLGLSSLSSLSQWSTGRPLAPITPLLWAMSPMGGWEAKML